MSATKGKCVKCGKQTASNFFKECDSCFELRISKHEPIIVADEKGRMTINPNMK